MRRIGLIVLTLALGPLLTGSGGAGPWRAHDIDGLMPDLKFTLADADGRTVTAADYAGKASLILYDAKAPEALVNALPGGNGIAFDWNLLGSSQQSEGFILSGGLTPDNVAKAIRVTGAPIVDVSSGVESAPGVKDLSLIRKFIEAAKAAR